jgi:hypothetical protein
MCWTIPASLRTRSTKERAMSSETDRPSLDKIMRRIARYRANPHRRYGLDRLADSWLQRIRRRWLRIMREKAE